MKNDSITNDRKIRFAVAGLGHIAQAAVLPAFAHASEKCELTTLISGDPEKLAELSRLYGVTRCYSYSDFEAALASKAFDAIYIALPNDMHKEYVIRAAQAGIHCLCEKPMALSESDCLEMIQTTEAYRVKLMIAYRLHFEEANMKAVETIEKGKIGQPRIFNSTFTMQVREGNIRTQSEHGGGPLYDIGIYCINAARYLFKSEPTEVMAYAAKSSDLRFSTVEESMSAIMKFPGEKLATFVCSFGSSDVSRYEVIGTEGRIVLDPAYEYADELEYCYMSKENVERMRMPKRDQFAPELLHFADSILNDKCPRPSGYEGLADIRIIEGLRQSAKTGKSVIIEPPIFDTSKPDIRLVTEKPAVIKPPLINVKSASK